MYIGFYIPCFEQSGHGLFKQPCRGSTYAAVYGAACAHICLVFALLTENVKT